MIEDLIMKDDIRLIIELIEDNGHDLDEETISSLTSYVEINLSSLNKIFDILRGITAYRNLVKQEEEKIEDLESQIQNIMNKYGDDSKGNLENEDANESEDLLRLKAENEELQNALEDTKFTLEALQVSEN